MNIDKFSNSETTSKTEVISKYFSKENDMDESLLEFQEKKKNVAGPKTVKPNTKKKKSKRPKAQRDIRNLLNPKRNELLKYSKDFDHLCKQSGIDVDSEQLQLAVALSKSLQDSEKVIPKVTDDSKPLTSQERTLKIRKTLQEYGFKVPQNVSVETNKRSRKHNKNYKLLLLSSSEKEQIISDRYTQVLLNPCNTVDNTLHFIPNDTIYYKTTYISYERLKSNYLLVLDVLEQPSNDINLLRNWAEIPGRPASPVFEGPYISFNDIQCSQDELDNLFSGSLKTCHEIIERKLVDNSVLTNCHINDDFTNQSNNSDMEVNKMNSEHNTQMSYGVPSMSKTLLPISEQLERSKSPDIFDDEVSEIMDEVIDKPIDNKHKSIISHDTMDLTECVNVQNITRKKSNDFMEMTNCVLQTEHQKNCFEEIDLTQESNVKHISICLKHSNKECSPDSNIICDADETNKGAQISYLADTHVEDGSSVTDIQSIKHIDNCSKDLICNLDSSDELPDIKINGKKNLSLDDTVIINEDCDIAVESNFDINENHEPVFDLTSENCALNPSCKYKVVDNSDKRNHCKIVGSNINVDDSKDQTVPYDNNVDLILSPKNYLNQPSCSYITKITNNSSIGSGSSYKIINNIIDIENAEDDFNNIGATKYCNNKSKEHNNGDEKLGEMNSSVNTRCNSEIENYDDNIDLTQSSNSMFSDDGIQESSQQSAVINDENSGVEIIDNVDKEENGDETVLYDDVDLTQFSNSSVNENTQAMSYNYVSNLPSCSGTFVHLGKIGDKSIDYDEMYDDVIESYSNVSKSRLKSETNLKTADKDSNKSSNTTYLDINNASTSRNHSVSFINPDKYVNKSTNEVIQANFDFGGISVLDNCTGSESPHRDSYLPFVNVKETENDVQVSSPDPSNNEHFDLMKTPENDEYIIKVDQVTPKPDYEAMSTPEMHRELDKYGVKPFKRKRAIKLLTYIYDQTHPFVESCIEETSTPSKKLKTSHPVRERSKSPEKSPSNAVLNNDKENTCIYVQTNNKPIITDIECSPEDWVFQKREKPKDLLKFMDKKCITVKTADNNARNKR
ncbi:uncharacterized protein LOC119836741 isoform X2 [Zerene cesonia]|uniref:uncharacterized protein LOC119836741 isoform X2 n=1 Tax=Zerene cesonia TaxID=33412 RepID=UPI0018E522F4|nr:uncharacterized protein LOC119836741 isoform X2 [Zerene cesonia]